MKLGHTGARMRRHQEGPTGLPSISMRRSIWVNALLLYASDRSGVRFNSLREMQVWLRSHPENTLNQNAILLGLTGKPPV